MPHATRTRPVATVAIAVALALLVAACSGDDSSTADGGSNATDASRVGPDGLIEITHRYGTTRLEARPQRIVSVDTQWTDVLVALDAPLAGAALDPSVPGGIFPWQVETPSSVERIKVTDAIPFEAVAALHPDLIVITYFATSQAIYDQLNAIAPTIGLLGDEEVDSWQDIAVAAGKLIGSPAQADALVTRAEGASAKVVADLPGLQGHTYALANYVAGDGIYVVADPDDGAATFFRQIGLDIDPDLVAIADGASGRARLSLERIDELDADLLVLLTNGTDPSSIPGYDLLPAVQTGAVALLDAADVAGLNTPTPLSIPYSLERIREALEALAR